MPHSSRRRSILAVFNAHMTCYRELILGISSYANTQEDWHLEVSLPNVDFHKRIASEKPDGLLLGAIETSDRGLDAAKMVPHCVGVCAQLSLDGLVGMTEVESDDLSVGALGAQHLLEKGFKHFGFAGQHRTPWSDLRWEGFTRQLGQAGYTASANFRDWDTVSQSLVSVPPNASDLDQWLTDLPKPVGIFACNDSYGCNLIRACRDLNLRVPDDVAVLGVDNDDMACAISNPPLSSVIVPWRRIGRRAASLLDQLISGDPVKGIVNRLPPSGIAERQSTDVVAIHDVEVRAALRFIRENASRQITVNDVVAAASMTRRALERKFQTLLGRTLLEEIRRYHIDRAKALLTESDLSVKEIARKCGFGSPNWFSRAFRDITGETPKNYRDLHRGN